MSDRGGRRLGPALAVSLALGLAGCSGRDRPAGTGTERAGAAALVAASPADRAPARSPEGCQPGRECSSDRGCGPSRSCVAGRCDPVSWPAPASCETFASGCLDRPFPDPCYERALPEGSCPARAEPLDHPRCVEFLELGAEGPGDDALVLARLHELWLVGRAASPPARPRTVLAVGDSISETMEFVSAASFDCRLPDFPFEAGYRLLGQPGNIQGPQTAMSGQTAAWGLEVVSPRLLASLRPEVATVSFGTNELWAANDSLDSYARNLRGIADRLIARGVLPILVTPPPGTFEPLAERQVCGRWLERPARTYSVAELAGVVRQVAAERSLPLVDVHRRFLAFDRPQGTAEARRRLGVCRDGAASSCEPSLWWRTLLGDGVHPCGAEDCAPGVELRGADLRSDSVLRMYKFLERTVMTRCAGVEAPPSPPGLRFDRADPVAAMRAAPDRPYCPDPVLR